MKNIIVLFVLISSVICAAGQTYNPSVSGVTVNTPLAPAQATPTDSRSMFFDPAFQKWRPYVSTAEVLSYLNLPKYRTGQFDIIVNTGGVLSAGVITGGINNVYFFKNGTSNSDLVLKGGVTSVNGQQGAVVVGNADSLKKLPIDTSANRNGYVLTFDSTNKKFFLSEKGSSGNYVRGTGIDITGNVISALNSSPLWNAVSLRGRSISTTAPTNGQVLKWDGIQYAPKDVAGIDTMYFSGDDFYIISSGDTTKTTVSGAVFNISSIHTDEQSGYSSDIPLGDLQQLSWISLANLQEALEANRDSIGRIEGIDSFQVYKGGVHIYSVKDSTGGGGGGGDNIYNTDGSLTGNRTMTMGANSLSLIGSGALNRFGGVFRMADNTTPASGTRGILFDGINIKGQRHNGTQWLSDSLSIGAAGVSLNIISPLYFSNYIGAANRLLFIDENARVSASVSLAGAGTRVLTVNDEGDIGTAPFNNGGTLNGFNAYWDKDTLSDIDGQKSFLANSLLKRIIIRSTVNIADLKIGTSPGASDIWNGVVIADVTPHVNDLNLELGKWIPDDITLYFTGLAGTGGIMYLWFNGDTDIALTP